MSLKTVGKSSAFHQLSYLDYFLFGDYAENSFIFKLINAAEFSPML